MLACPRRCEGFFNGGNTGSSNFLESHIARGSCRDRRTQAFPPELDGPFLSTTMVGVRATLSAHAIAAKSVLHMAPPPHAAAVEFCRENPAFTPIHLRTSGCQSVAALPNPYLQQMLPCLPEIFTKAATNRGDAQWEAVWGALFLFPTLVLGPHKVGAASSTVKTEIADRLDFWNRGQLEELAIRAKSFRRPPSGRSKAQRGGKRAAQLIRKK